MNKKTEKKPLPFAMKIFIALVAGVDRIFDMGRTTLNITGDAFCAIIISNMMKKNARDL